MSISLIYDSTPTDEANGAINFGSDTFKVMLVNSTYAAIADATKKRTHTKRSDVTANEVTGTGYTAGGTVAAVTVTKDTTNDRCDITIGAVSWAASTITASGAVVYKSRGGLASADELVCYIDFGGSVSSTAATFALSSSIFRQQL